MRRHLFSVLAVVLLFVACGNPAIKRGYGETPEELGKAVVAALNAQSEEDLHRLRVDKDMYMNELWPAFQAQRPALNFTADFAWGNLNKKCLTGVTKWIRRYNEKNYAFVRIQFTEPTQTYDGFQLRRGTVLTVKTPDGVEHDLRILGSVVEKDRYYRLLSYDN